MHFFKLLHYQVETHLTLTEINYYKVETNLTSTEELLTLKE